MTFSTNPMLGFKRNQWTGLPEGVAPNELYGAIGGYGASDPNSASALKPDFMQSMLGYTDDAGNKVNGWGGLALGGAQALGNAFMALQQYGLAKDTFRENKRQFEMNFDAQRRTTNAALEDRQRARLASNPGGYQSVGDYMTQYGIQ